MLKHREKKELNLPLPNTQLMNMCMLLATKRRGVVSIITGLFLAEVGRTSHRKDVTQKVAD